jgi:hypothetical protein
MHPAFEFIGLDSNTLKTILERCKMGGFERRGISADSINQMLRHTILRLKTALNDKKTISYGIRQEYRIRISVLREHCKIAAER